MIRERASVVAVRDSMVWVDCESRRNCARCAQGKGCGGALLGQALGQRRHRVRARAAGAVAVGDAVSLELPERSILVGAMLAYLVPLCGLIAGAVAGDGLAGEPGALVGGMAGFSLAWLCARLWARGAASLDPVVRRL